MVASPTVRNRPILQVEVTEMSSAEYALQLPDGGGPIPIGFLDEASADVIRSMLERSETIQVRLGKADESDTAGHAVAPGSVFVTAMLGDDVEGHTLSLRFPSPAEAALFQKRLLAAGLLAATLAVGAVGANAISQSSPSIGVAPGAAITESIYAPAVRDDYKVDDAAAAQSASAVIDSQRHHSQQTEAPAQYAPAVRDDYKVDDAAAAADDELPDQTNLRGTDKSLPGV